MREDIIPMKRRELARGQVIRRVLDGNLTRVAAGALLSLCERQVRRIVLAVKRGGAAALRHGNRGRPSKRKLDARIKARAIALVRDRYADFGPTLAAETMAERGEVDVSRETLRQWMVEEGLWHVRRRRRKPHVWRERKAHLGEMLQSDGSHHDWLEGRGPKMVLIGFIDDATGRAYGRFYGYEGVFPALDALRRYIGLYGLPQSVYYDKHSTYKTTRQPDTEEALRGEPAKTQLERALEELGIQVIHAHSPQAKGRIERSFRTLQDRLVKAMRLAGVKTREEANVFLEGYWPRYNGRFAKEPREAKDLHRPVPKRLKLEEVLCLKAIRTINSGFLIKWRSRTYVIREPSIVMKGRKVEIREHGDGRVAFWWMGRPLEAKEVAVRPKPAPAPAPARPAPRPRSPWIPPPDHPWRRSFLHPDTDFGPERTKSSEDRT